MTKVRWLLIGWIFVISAVAYLDRVNISIAAPTIEKEFGLTDIQFGWILSAFVLGYAASQAPGGWVADRLGPRKILTFGVIWWAVVITATTLVSPMMGGALTALICMRFLLGMGEAVVYPASNAFVARWIPSAERGVANGIIFAGVGLGAAVASPFTAYLLANYGWRFSFMAAATLGLFAGGVWFLICRDRPDLHSSVSAAEREYIIRGLPAAGTAKATAKLSWGQILSDRNILTVTLSYFTYGYTAYIFFSWFYVYLNKAHGLDLKKSALYTMLPYMAMAAGSVIGGVIGDALTKTHGKRVGRCYTASGALVLAAIFVFVGAQVQDVTLASITLAGGAGALYLSQSAFWAISADIGKRSAGSVSGFMNMGNQIGGAVTASLTPVIAQGYGWAASFMVAGALCAFGAIMWLLVRPSEE
jgi:ACS family glucarate transporter-like MFS transporter